MRLSKIKLAGFKSFVDPTSIPLPSNLVGVVGPNGCGKSNVIDAVRWVMGESSAKNLRGDSMADVIFNGSTTRKPVGQASIELLFDNADGTLGGQYAQYAEISIKRVVSRDGQSSYFLNGTRCRRRDITDVFLGTGLGPRSYSIIEQGMISRFIEAKPEDLRNFLEEAAGISKYKERRRETENRIQHTRENLDRLNDLREELNKQIDKLQRQARTAERYTELKQEERLLRAQLHALRYQSLNQETAQQERAIAEQEVALEQDVARQRAIEAKIEQQREQHIEANDAFNEVQGCFYRVGADIARVEQAIQHARDRRQQLRQDMEQAERSWNDIQTHLDADQRKIEELNAGLLEQEPALAQLQQTEQLSGAAYAEAEQRMYDWQTRWDEFNQQAAEPSQTAQVERTRLQNLEQHLAQVQQRLARLEEERGHFSTDNLAAEVETVQAQQSEVELELQRLSEALQAHQTRIHEQREHNHNVSGQLDQARGRLQGLRGRHASLEALQQAALGKRQGAVSDWLQRQNLHQAQRLAQGLAVESGWERAVECVLGFHLEAVCVEGLDPVAGALGNLQHGSLALFDTQARPQGLSSSRGTPLAAKVQSPWPVDAVLSGVYAVEDLSGALALRAGLAAHESVITRDGLWLGPNWLRVSRDADEKAGVLHREQELKETAAQIAQLEQQVAELQLQLEDGRQQLRSLEEERDAMQVDLNQVNRRHSELRAQLGGKQARLEQLRARAERIQNEMEELREQSLREQAEHDASRKRLHQALEQVDLLSRRREALQAEREQLREAVNRTREQAHLDRSQAHQIALRIQTLRTERQTTEQGLERMHNQLELLAGRREEITRALAEGDAPIVELQSELETLLTSRMAVEKELGEARRHLEEIDHAMREASAERQRLENQVLELRTHLEQKRMAWQGLKVRLQTVQEQIAESGYELQALQKGMPEGANEEAWHRTVEEISERIQRLGPINLAAIEEFKTQSERKEYLDAQFADLTQALETLEDAIRKIDRETRTRFKETFDKVNSQFQALFPRLFGGGHAYLELTGEDLLDTGVTVMARPPGKRNSTIHLLSGGEKALTAVALVFSIFELNPAPFCMLDEVDAPLDEANVGRYCSLVKEMSERVQFIFITHNKTTMEMAQQLTGVTMQEPGVSRLVAVDVEEAYQMAVV